MSGIYEAISEAGDHPFLDHDLQAYREAAVLGEVELMAQIVKDAKFLAGQIRSGRLSRPEPSMAIESVDQPENQTL